MAMQFVIQPPGGDNFLLPVEPTVDFAVVKALCASRLGLHPSNIWLFNAATGAEYVDGSFVSKVPNLSSIRVEVAAAPPPYSSGAAAAPVAPAAAATATAAAAGAAAASASVPAATPYTDPADECSICLEAYAPTHPPVALKCGHAFHEVCVRQWAQNSAYCPLCRRKIELVGVTPVAGGAAAAAPAVPDRSGSAIAAAAAAAGGAAAAAARTGKALSPAAGGAAATGTHTTTVAALPMPGTGMTLYIVDNGTGTPPTPEEVELALAATRKQLAANSEHSGLLKAVKDFKESETAKMIGRTAVVAGHVAYATGKVVGAAALSTGKVVGAAAIDVGGRALKSGAAFATSALRSAFTSKPTPPPSGPTTIILTQAPGAAAAAAPPAGYGAPGSPAYLPAPYGAAAAAAAGGGGGAPAPARDLMRCPQCQQVIAPPPGADMFRCACGIVLSR